MKSKLFVLILSFTLSALLFMSTVSAQTAVAGVYKNEIFTYNYDIFWDSTNPSSSPTFFTDLNQTEQVQIKILEVSGSRIDLLVTEQYHNGTENVQSGYIDISTGIIDAPYGYLIIGANLNVGQNLYPLGGHQTITSSYVKSYPTGQRETTQYNSITENEETSIEFDKIKGIAISYSHELVETSGGYTTTIQEILTNTNSDVWAVAPTVTPTPSTSPPTSTASTSSPTVTANPTSTQTAAPSSVIPEISIVAVPLLLAGASAVLLLAKSAKNKF